MRKLLIRYASNEMRVTINQGYLIRYVRPEAIKPLYAALDKVGLGRTGI